MSEIVDFTDDERAMLLSLCCFAVVGGMRINLDCRDQRLVVDCMRKLEGVDTKLTARRHA